jgi:tetratricopeptide (TPR) repeat protein
VLKKTDIIKKQFSKPVSNQTSPPLWSYSRVSEISHIWRFELVGSVVHHISEYFVNPDEISHLLLIGPRGSAKNIVINGIVKKLKSNDDTLVIRIIENGSVIISYPDFCKQMIDSVMKEYPDKAGFLSKDFQDIHEIKQELIPEKVLEALLSFAGGRKVALLIENIDNIIETLKNFADKYRWNFCELINDKRIFICATASTDIPEIEDDGQWSNKFFNIEYLKPLSFGHSFELLFNNAREGNNWQLTGNLNTPEYFGRVRAMHEFTQGNHWLLQMLYKCLKNNSSNSMESIFLDFVTRLQPYYADQMQQLPKLQKKIVLYHCLVKILNSVNDIARDCLTTPSSLSKQLNELDKKKGIVTRNRIGRSSYYEIRDILFRICYQTDLEKEKNNLMSFLNFLCNFFTGKIMIPKFDDFYRCLKQSPANSKSQPTRSTLKHSGNSQSQILRTTELYFFQKIDSSLSSSWSGDFFKEWDNPEDRKSIIKIIRTLPFPEDKDANVRLANFFIGEGNFEEAQSKVTDAEVTLGKTLSIQMLQTEIQLFRGYFNKAIAPNSTALKEYPNDVRVIASSGLIKIMVGNKAGATEEIEKLKELADDDPVICAIIGYFFSANDMYERAQEYFEKSIELDDSDLFIFEMLGRALCGLNRFSEGISKFQTILEKEPDNWKVKLLVGIAYYYAGEETNAEEVLSHVRDNDPENEVVARFLSLISYYKNDMPAALKHFELVPDDKRKLGLNSGIQGQIKFDRESDEEAIELFRKALEIDKDIIRQTINQIAEYIENGNYETDERYYKVLTEAKYNRNVLLFFRGFEYLQKKKFAKSNKIFEDLLTNDSENQTAMMYQIVSLLGNERCESADAMLKKLDLTTAEISESVITDFMRRTFSTLFVTTAPGSYYIFILNFIEFIENQNLILVFERAIAQVLMDTLKDHSNISEDRLREMENVLQMCMRKCKEVNLSVTIRFLRVAIDKFKKNAKLALLRIPLEERRFFCRELEIDQAVEEKYQLMV